MAIDPPYRLDPFRNIINVRWQAMYLAAVWNFTRTITTLVADVTSCSPVSFVPPEGWIGSDACSTAMTFTLAPITPSPGQTLSGSPTLSPSTLSWAPWTVNDAYVETKTINAFSGSFNIMGGIMVENPGCAGSELGGDNGQAGGGFRTGTGVVDSISVDASGITASYQGVTYNPISCVISSTGFGPSVAMTFQA